MRGLRESEDRVADVVPRRQSEGDKAVRPEGRTEPMEAHRVGVEIDTTILVDNLEICQSTLYKYFTHVPSIYLVS